MAKQMIMERQQVWVPARKFGREVLGQRDDIDGGYSWKEYLSVDVCTEGLKTLTDCVEEKIVESRRPDILAKLEGQPIAIEIANTHFCDDTKLKWLKDRNLTTLEIDVGMSPDTDMSDIRSKLEARIFTSSSFKTWLVHSGDTFALSQIDAAENHLRVLNSKKDELFLKDIERKRTKKKRKDEFKESIKDIDYWTLKINRDLTLRIAYSKIRCTLKWHGYSQTPPDVLKNATLELAKRFGGYRNDKYNLWEFRAPEGKAEALYYKMIRFMEDALSTPFPISSLKQQQNISTVPQIKKPPVTNETVFPVFQNEADEEMVKERAAVLEYEDKLSRSEAEYIAIRELFRSKIK